MQLADQTRDTDQKMSPAIYAALVDSLFQNPGPMFAGALCAAIAAIMTALKTGEPSLWPCVALLVFDRRCPRLRHGRYKTRTVRCRPRTRPRAGKPAISSARCSMPPPLGLVRRRAARQRRRRCAHDLHIGHTLLHGGRRRPHLWASVDLPCADVCWHADRCAWRWRCTAVPITSGWRSSTCCFSWRSGSISTSLQRDFRPGAGRARTRSRARQPVRHRAEQHAAWPVHVRRRRAACSDEPPFQ